MISGKNTEPLPQAGEADPGRLEKRHRGIARPAAVILSAAVVLAALHFTPLSKEAMELRVWLEYFDRRGWTSELAFAGFSGLLIAAGIPRLIFFGIAGVLFGFPEGLAAAMLGSMAGSYLCFRVVRWSCRDWVVGKFGEKRFFGQITRAESTVASVFLIRQLPVSNLFINAGLALTRIGSGRFLAGSFLGFLPQGIVAVLIGSGMAEDVAWHGVVQLSAAAMVLYFVSVLGWKRRAARKLRVEPANSGTP